MTRHSFDPTSFTAGLVFTVVGLVMLSGQVTITTPVGEWVLPILGVIVGVAFLSSALRRATSDSAAHRAVAESDAPSGEVLEEPPR